MKKIILMVLSAFVLIGCNSKSINAKSIAKTINKTELKEIIAESTEKVETGLLDKESAISSYKKVIEKYNAMDSSTMTKETSEFISLYSQFAEELINKLEAEDSTAAYIGIKEDNFVQGIMIYVLEENFVLSDEARELLNNSPVNEIEKVYVKENVVVTVDKGFVSDFTVFTEYLDKIVEEYIGK